MKHFPRFRAVVVESRYQEVPLTTIHMMEMESQRVFVLGADEVKSGRTLTSE